MEDMKISSATFSVATDKYSLYVNYRFAQTDELGDLKSAFRILRSTIPAAIPRAEDIQVVSLNDQEISNIDLLERIELLEPDFNFKSYDRNKEVKYGR